MKIISRLQQLSSTTRKIVAAVLLLLLLILIYPFQTTVAPEWNLQVVDDQGASVAGINVTEHWQHNLLESTVHEELQRTSGEGQVVFPARKIRASLVTRLFATIGRFLRDGTKAKLNPYAAVVVWGSTAHETNVAVYKEGEPPPARVVVRRTLRR